MAAQKKSLWCYAIAGWSGFYVMLVELLSGRLIAPSFGSSIYVWGSVIFVFMLGLAIGYLFGGIFSRYSPSLPRLCCILVASAIATLPTLFFGTQFLDFMFDNVTDPRFGSLLTCLGLFLVPTIFAGMVSPYAIRILVRNRESSGHDAGYLYFVSTIGSSVGTLLTAFYFVLLFEVNTILMTAIGISVALGGLGALTNYRKV
ncbi:MAG TPA: fused MFS/spermidine synthase [Micropepsaceae bacterium]|nr:fused MFS/spermidine synthase [Micropepsaceae bacterium]